MTVPRATTHANVLAAALDSGRARVVSSALAVASSPLWVRTIELLVVVAALARSANAQTVRLGVIMDRARTQLETEWTDDPRQLERAYCVTGWWAIARLRASERVAEDDSIFRVTRLEPANVTSATPMSAEFECSAGVPELHVHPPTTCPNEDPATCIAGGLNAYSCQPSREDLVKLTRRGDPFAVIQCDRRTVRFYYPSEYGPRDAVTFVSARRLAPPYPAGNMTPAMTRAVPAIRESPARAGGTSSAAP